MRRSELSMLLMRMNLNCWTIEIINWERFWSLMEMLPLLLTVDLKIIPLKCRAMEMFSLCLFTINLCMIQHIFTVLVLLFFFCCYQVSIFLFSLKWILISIIINVTIIIYKTNHFLLVKILKIHRNILCIDHPKVVKIFKIHRNMLCVHHHLLPMKILKIHRNILCIDHLKAVKNFKIHRNMLCVHHHPLLVKILKIFFSPSKMALESKNSNTHNLWTILAFDFLTTAININHMFPPNISPIPRGIFVFTSSNRRRATRSCISTTWIGSTSTHYNKLITKNWTYKGYLWHMIVNKKQNRFGIITELWKQEFGNHNKLWNDLFFKQATKAKRFDTKDKYLMHWYKKNIWAYIDSNNCKTTSG